MLSFHAQLKVFVATAPCDLRMSFNGLWNAAQQQLGEDPKSGALFGFGNRRRHQTTFSIPIGHCRDCLSMASPAWATTARNPETRKERERGR